MRGKRYNAIKMRDMSAFPDKAIYEFIHIAQWARNSSGLDKIEF